VYSLYLITYSRLTTISDDNDEMRAQELVERGQIDEAIAIYQRSAPESAHAFYNIGILYADKKGDYDSAIKYYKKALKIQEKVSH
jgi:tetratricopeptide (TPR) repeat protein